jgi:hypothetical protein
MVVVLGLMIRPIQRKAQAWAVLEERVVRLVEANQIEQSMVEVVVEHPMYAPM